MEQESYPLKSCPHPRRLVQVNIGLRVNFQEIVEEGPPAGGVGLSVCPPGGHGSWCKLQATIP